MDLVVVDEKQNSFNLLEDSFYAILGVSADATEDEIRKAYKVMARNYHPDRNLDNPEADKMFQKIFEAYSVLSDPKKRLLYDNKGNWDQNAFDFLSFYRSLFGGDAFVDVIGDISYGVLSEYLESEEYTSLPEVEKNQALMDHLNAKQKSRIEMLVYKLQIKLEPFMSGLEDNPILTRDVEEKSRVPGGAHLLSLLASVYKSEAAKNGKLVESVASYISEKKRTFTNIYNFVKLLIKTNNLNNKLKMEPGNPELNRDMNNIRMYSIWKMGKLEIEDVNRKACKMFLNDKSMDSTVLERRRRGVMKIANMYQKQAKIYLSNASEKENRFGTLNMYV